MSLFEPLTLNPGVVIALAVLLTGLIYGAGKGVFKMLFGMISWLLVIVMLFAFSPKVTDFLKSQTPLENWLYTRIERYVTDHAADLWGRLARVDAVSDEKAKVNTEDVDAETSAEENKQKSGDANPMLAQVRLALPDAVSGLLDQMEAAARSGKEDLTAQVTDSVNEAAVRATHQAASAIASVWSGYLLRGISLVVTFLIAKILVTLLGALIGVADRLPGVHGVSHLLGAMVGLLLGAVVIWLLLAVFQILSLTAAGAAVAAWVEESRFLSWLAQANPFLPLVTGT